MVLLLIAALPGRLQAAAALAVFAPMSVLSMAACTAAFAWMLTRPVLQPVYRSVLIPAFGGLRVLFGTDYTRGARIGPRRLAEAARRLVGCGKRAPAHNPTATSASQVSR